MIIISQPAKKRKRKYNKDIFHIQSRNGRVSFCREINLGCPVRPGMTGMKAGHDGSTGRPGMTETLYK